LEKSEPLMTADGFYEKNVGSISFFMRVASRGEIYMSVSFAVAALAGLTANAVFKKMKMPGVFFP
jgi:hypothetical protein